MNAQGVHFVGGVPLDRVEGVFRTAAAAVGNRVGEAAECLTC